MNILMIGQNSKMASVLNEFANTIMVIDTNIAFYRNYKEVDNLNVIKSTTNIRKKSGIIKRTKEIIKWIHQYNTDVIFTNDKYSMIAAWIASKLSLKKIILISTSHNSYAWQNKSNVKKFAKLIKLTTDGYIALASFVYNDLLNNHINQKRILLLPNIIEHENFIQKSDYNLENGILKIIYCGVIFPQKNQKLIIETIKQLKNKDITVTVDFYGDIADEIYKNQLDCYIAQHNLTDFVKFKGRVDNDTLRDLLPKYDVYISPSLMEMSPFNILEAKAAALPIIANNVGGISDLISNKEDGLLLSSPSIDEMEKTLITLYNNKNLRQNLGERAYQNVSTKQNKQKAALKLKEFIENI